MSLWNHRLDQNTNKNFGSFCPGPYRAEIIKFFVGILVQTKTSKRHFEINWPLELAQKNKEKDVVSDTRWSERTRNLLKKEKAFLRKSMKVWKLHIKRIFHLGFQVDADGGRFTQWILLFQKTDPIEAIDYNFNYDFFNSTQRIIIF